jgi:hypothetical protein
VICSLSLTKEKGLFFILLTDARVGGPEPVLGLSTVENEHLNREADLHVDDRLAIHVALFVS